MAESRLRQDILHLQAKSGKELYMIKKKAEYRIQLAGFR